MHLSGYNIFVLQHRKTGRIIIIFFTFFYLPLCHYNIFVIISIINITGTLVFRYFVFKPLVNTEYYYFVHHPLTSDIKLYYLKRTHILLLRVRGRGVHNISIFDKSSV